MRRSPAQKAELRRSLLSNRNSDTCRAFLSENDNPKVSGSGTHGTVCWDGISGTRSVKTGKSEHIVYLFFLSKSPFNAIRWRTSHRTGRAPMALTGSRESSLVVRFGILSRVSRTSVTGSNPVADSFGAHRPVLRQEGSTGPDTVEDIITRAPRPRIHGPRSAAWGSRTTFVRTS